MGLEQLLKEFLLRLKEKQHLLPLLPQQIMLVGIESDQETLYITLSKKDIYVRKDCSEQVDVLLTGTLASLQSLFLGKVKLQQLIRLKELDVYSSFRHLLLIESLLHLCKPHNNGIFRIDNI
jgi:ubiquinone biosynthesis protein UbiJ